jgi:hypothetical protein
MFGDIDEDKDWQMTIIRPASRRVLLDAVTSRFPHPAERPRGMIWREHSSRMCSPGTMKRRLMPVVDQVVLDSWNGRSSIWMSANKGDPFLHWMLLGRNELFDVWLHARLTWAVADRLAEHPEDNTDDVLTLIPNAPVRFVLEDSGRPLLSTDTGACTADFIPVCR